MPQTWVVPRGKQAVLHIIATTAAASSTNTTNTNSSGDGDGDDPRTWLMYKPDFGSQARGGEIIRPLSLVAEGDDAAARVAHLLNRAGVVQRYIADPFLLHGFKHHLRLYLVQQWQDW